MAVANKTECPIGIVFSKDYSNICCVSPKFENRFRLIINILNAYGLLKNFIRIEPLIFDDRCSIDEVLKMFHSADYLEALRNLSELHTNSIEPHIPTDMQDLFETFGLSYDCPGFGRVWDYAVACVRGSLAAADSLINGRCHVAINWAGGWHHAKRSEASGFCYLNDIVLAIQRLLSSSRPNANGPTRVLYLDFDLHHGDGVEDAFWYSHRVVTFSVHHASPGFFPGSGTWSESVTENGTHFKFPCGAGYGRYSAFNLPLAEGANDVTWSQAVLPVLSLLRTVIQPTYVVIQCGADGLATDPHKIFNLTNSCPITQEKGSAVDPIGIGAYWRALKLILSWNVPILLLGGGGYNFTDTARLWTTLTALIIQHTKGVELNLPVEIPYHSHLDCYGPDFDLSVSCVPKVDLNTTNTIAQHHSRILNQICTFADLNALPYDRTVLSSQMKAALEIDF